MKNYAAWRSVASALCVGASVAGGPAMAAGLAGNITFHGNGIPSALVSAYDTRSGRKAVTVTNDIGAYRFNNLAPGLYVVIVDKDGRRIYQGKTQVAEPQTRFDIRW